MGQVKEPEIPRPTNPFGLGEKEEENRCPCDCPAYKDGYKVGVITTTQRMIEVACDAYCAVCDTQECGESCVECHWVKKFRTEMYKKTK